MSQRDLEACGIHSLFSEADRNGTERERHVAQVDIDSKAPLQQPKIFRRDVIRALRAHGLMDAYVFESRKGVHLWSPWLQSRRFAERFEGHFFAWSGDDFHAKMGWKNGGTVLRFTPKPGEGEPCASRVGSLCLRGLGALFDDPNPDCPICFGTGWTGPQYVAHIRAPPEALAPWSFWSRTHFDFMAQRYGIPDAARPKPEERGVESDGLRVERYYTYRPQPEPIA